MTRKGKEVVISTSLNHNGAEDEEEEGGFDHSKINGRPFSPFPSFSSRNASSKYDFVKVKVWLGENADHCYVLSRFLLSRMLTVTKIPNHVAIKIALELKKLLIDNSLLDVSQSDLEANLFKVYGLSFFNVTILRCLWISKGVYLQLMERRGYGEEYINHYKMMTRFHYQRVPLVILVCGTACVGKSTIATQLAQRLNLPNVLQTDMVYELLRTSTDAPLTSTPVWAREFSSSEELITEFCRECRIVRKGLAGDLKKAMKDGKPIIIEGIHLDPSIYLMDEENKLTAKMPEKCETNTVSVSLDDDPARQLENNSVSENNTENSNCTTGYLTSEEGKSVNLVNKVVDSQESIDKAGSISDSKGETIKDLEGDRKTSVSLKSGPEPIIIPIVLKMAEFDHKALLEEWISTRSFSDKCSAEGMWEATSLITNTLTGLAENVEKDRSITNLKIIQDYLCSFKSQGLTVANISATTFPQTLDWLHGYLLQHFAKDYGVLSKAFHQCPVKMVDNQLKISLPADVSLSSSKLDRIWRNIFLALVAESNYRDAVAESKLKSLAQRPSTLARCKLIRLWESYYQTMKLLVMAALASFRSCPMWWTKLF
ncbi:hypothetical protein POTOM_013781 [Populus tomentosa]|uniref:P-loop containing nucleoside triphosphate hydrolases superfamily protein n=1 Tax=Populus tomentosa TaxID=118781 RepID=A0A8X8A6M5_POPTO|nr:hypothetical protein POTOM_013781 [Populus tomentosa]